MPTELTEFQIEGLHGRNQTIDIPIRDNRLVLVGENGTGKSTVANLLYYVLTQQWRRISEYRFVFIEVKASHDSLRFSHEDIEALATSSSAHLDEEIRTRYPPALIREVSRMMAQDPVSFDLDDEGLIHRVGMLTRGPRSLARQPSSTSVDCYLC